MNFNTDQTNAPLEDAVATDSRQQNGTINTTTSNGSSKPSPTVSAFTKQRLRRYSSDTMFADFAHEHGSSLKGTAYEGQDRQFHRVEPVVSALNPQYEALVRYQQQQQQAKQGIGTGGGELIPADQPAAGVYWPYRTEISADVQGAQGDSPQGMSPLMAPPSAQNFYVPEKCDFGLDPQWCEDYVQQFVKWFEQYESRGKTICISLMNSLENSDHRCCNTLKKMHC